MKGIFLARMLATVLGLAGAAAAAVWVLDVDLGSFRPARTTGERAVPLPSVVADGPRPWDIRRETLAAEAPPAPGLWPCFRGPDRDAICKDEVKLADKWPAAGPPIVWRMDLGEGHAGEAVRNGRVYVMDYEPPPYLELDESEVKDLQELCRQLALLGRAEAKTPQKRIWELLPAEGRRLVDLASRQPLEPAAKLQIIAALNEVIRSRGFYRQDYFEGVRLSAYLRLSISSDPVAGVQAVSADAPLQKVLRINRTLLEKALGGLVRPRWRGDVVRCFSLATGRELWRTSYRVEARIEHGVSRSVPAVTDKYVVTLGPRCQAACLDAETGEPIWRRKYDIDGGGEHEFPYIDLVREFGATVPDWHAAQCPLIDVRPDGVEAAILATGGEALFVAVDCATGGVLWRTPAPAGWKRTMTHSSIAPMTFAGRRMYVYSFQEGAVGVSADDGALLWSTTEWKNNVIAPSPLPLPDGRIFFTAGFGGGSVMIQLVERGGQIVARKLFARSESELSCYQQTPIYHGGLVYCVLTAGAQKGQLACADLDGKVLWHSGSAHRFAWGPFAMADGKMFLLEESGLLTIARVSGRGFTALDKAKVLDGSKAWAPMAFAAGRMIVRNETEMVCLDLAAGAP